MLNWIRRRLFRDDPLYKLLDLACEDFCRRLGDGCVKRIEEMSRAAGNTRTEPHD